jgi:hypothetical protein
MLSILLFVSSAFAADYSAFSCDTVNATDGQFFFDTASIPILYDRKHCPFAGPNADPLGPCFKSPTEVKAQLDLMPEGKRGISLEGTSMYYLQKNDSTRTRYFQDDLGCGFIGPFMDTWANALNHRFTKWFANFSSIGGKVDIVLSDFEMGGHAYWYSFAQQQGNCSGQTAQDILQKDSRWPPLLKRLNEEGLKYNASFDDLHDMKSWTAFAIPFSDWRPWVRVLLGMLTQRCKSPHLSTDIPKYGK